MTDPRRQRNRFVRFLAKQLFVATKIAFERELLTGRFDSAQGRALLFELERAAPGSNAAIGLKDDLTLEHVLPQRPKAGTWSAFTGDDRAICPHRVGNLLLAQPFISSLGNVKGPAKQAKIQAVQASQTPLTVAALSFATWNKQTINARSKMLSKKASGRQPRKSAVCKHFV